MTRRQFQLTIKQGETFRRYLQFRNAVTGAVIDLDAIGVTTGTLIIKPAYDEDAVVELTTANGGIVIENDTKSNGYEYSAYLHMSKDATAALVQWGEGVFDLEFGDGLREKNVADGIAVLSPSTIP